MTSSPLLLRGTRLDGSEARSDVLIEGGRIAAIGTDLTGDAAHLTGDAAHPEVVDVAGRTVLPGLWDAHVHFNQWAMVRQRLDLAGADSAAEAARLIAEAVAAQPGAETVFLGHGFRDGLWPDVPSAGLLDALVPDRPVVAVSGDLHCGWLNSAALRRFGVAAHPTGILREREFMFLMNDLQQVSAAQLDEWALRSAQEAAARGVVGIVDYEIADNVGAWRRRMAGGFDGLRVSAGLWAQWLEAAIGQGLRTGDTIPGTGGLLTQGALKVITDGSLNTRTAYCHEPYPGLEGPDAHGVLSVGPEELVPLMSRARAAGLHAAIHAIGDRANGLALDAFAETGVAGTIEHAQLLMPEDVPRFAELGVVASVQPRHAVDDWEVADRYWAGRTGRAFVLRALIDAGARLVLGSDAPVAPLDPWVAIAAAVSRDFSEPGGLEVRWYPEQEISLEEAIAASARGRSRIAVGDPADLTVTDLSPWSLLEDVPRAGNAARDLAEMPVAATLLAGRWTHRSTSLT